MKRTDFDELDWERARMHSRFVQQVLSYVLINIGLWILWYILPKPDAKILPWPIFSMIGWGINVLFMYIKTLNYKRDTPRIQRYEGVS